MNIQKNDLKRPGFFRPSLLSDELDELRVALILGRPVGTAPQWGRVREGARREGVIDTSGRAGAARARNQRCSCRLGRSSFDDLDLLEEIDRDWPCCDDFKFRSHSGFQVVMEEPNSAQKQIIANPLTGH